MVSRGNYEDLLSYDVPILFVGDHGQLPPVGENMVHLMQDPDYRLEEIHRNAGPIARFSEHLRNGDLPRTWEGDEAAVQVVTKGQKGDIGDWLDTQVICGLNRTRVEVNKAFRRRLGRERDPVEVGERILSLRNDKDKGIFNGTQGVVLDVVSSEELVLSVDGQPVSTTYDGEKFGQLYLVREDRRLHPFDYAYAITCHKAQGDQYRKVTVVDEANFMGKNNPDNIRRWRYTAASRAQEFVRWICR
jgi:exodeoxyribonuclease-5